ncbi:MAG: FG-GAP-like repeat-containing protein [Kofleriaceae bacterium]|nr:FG-GAP-like repeat-containing protein [Kofleriaceae bacterium]
MRRTTLMLTLMAAACSGGDDETAEHETEVGAPVQPPSPPKPWGFFTNPVITSGQPMADYLPGASEVTPSGAYTYRIPLAVPPGRGGMAPDLALVYTSSSTGNGAIGVGWSIDGLSSITRCNASPTSEGYADGIDFAPLANDPAPDRFCLDGAKLVLIAGTHGAVGAEYRTELETFARITVTGSDDAGPTTFEVRTKDGRIRTYQAHARERSHIGPNFLPTSDGPVKGLWVMTSEADRSGNAIVYTYSTRSVADPTFGTLEQVTLDEIQYTAHPDAPAARRVKFEYVARTDKRVMWGAGVQSGLHRALDRIVMYAPNPALTTPVWMYKLDYTTSTSSKQRLLASVKRCAAGTDGSEMGCTWAKQFTWTQQAKVPSFTVSDLGGFDIPQFTGVGMRRHDTQVFDANGDGADDLLLATIDPYGGWLGDGDGEVLAATLRLGSRTTPLVTTHDVLGGTSAYPATTRLAASRPMDFDGDGKVDLWSVYSGGPSQDYCEAKVIHWNGTTFTAGIATNEKHMCTDAKHLFLDWNGDGRLDYLSALDTYVEVDDDDLTPGKWKLQLNTGGAFAPAYQTGLSSGCPAKVTDVDGDGRGELVTSRSSAAGDCDIDVTMRSKDVTGTVEYNTNKPEDFLGTMYAVSPRAHFGDFNGDGLEDALTIAYPTGQGSWLTSSIQWNTGYGFRAPQATAGLDITNWSVAHPQSIYVPDDGRVRLADFNRDGRTDVMILSYLPVGTGVNEKGFAGHQLRVSIGLSNGDGTFETVTPTLPYGTFNHDFDLVRLGDFNGDGYTDIAMVTEENVTPQNPTGDHRLVVALQNPAVVDRISAVRDEKTAWDAESVTYATELSPAPEAPPSTCVYPLSCTGRRGFPVVRSHTTRAHLVDPVAPTSAGRTRYFSYEDPVVDAVQRGFIGFGKVRVWDPSVPSETVMRFDPRTFVVAPLAPNPRRYPSGAVPVTVTIATPILTPSQLPGAGVQTARITRTTNQNEVRFENGGKTYWLATTAARETTWEETVTVDLAASTAEHITGIVEPANAPIRTDHSTQFDSYGNPTTQTRTTKDGVSSVTELAYEYRVADWLIGLVRQEAETRFEPAAPLEAVTRTTDYGYDDQGRLAWVANELDASDPDVRTTLTFGRDALGAITSVTRSGASKTAGPTSRTVNVEYAPTFGGQPDERIFVSQVWAPFPTAAYRPSTWIATHPAFGVPFATMDNNGRQHMLWLDGLGRPRQEAGDGIATTTFDFSGRVDAFIGPNGPSLNGLVRTATAGARVWTETTDARGLVIEHGEPAFANGQAHVARTYDALGRVLAVSRPYTGVASDATTYVYDSLGRLIEETSVDGKKTTHQHTLFTSKTIDPNLFESRTSLDVHGRMTSSTNVVDGTPIEMHYTHTPFDLLEEAIDDDGNAVRFTYDVRGRLTRRDDPDRGTTLFAYSGLDDLREQKHLATGKTTTFSYDALGRRTAMMNPDGLTKFFYDSQPGGIGALARTESPDGVVTEHAYDAMGRPIGMTHTIEGVAYTVSQPLDATGRAQHLAYPAPAGAPALTVTPTYTPTDGVASLGYANAGGPTTNLISIFGRTLDGKLANATLGNGVMLRYSYFATGAAQRFEARKGTSLLMDLSWGYHPNGLVESRIDAIANRTERFTYDGARRLTTWITTLPGMLRTLAYDYDALGNIEHVFLNGNLQLEGSTFGKPDGSQPHALATRTVGAAVEQYAHDLQGRQTAGPARTVVYNEKDLPKSITKNGQTWQFKYDAFGQRVLKSGPDGKTVYIGDLYERRIEGGVTKHVYFVHAPGARVAQLVRTGNAAPAVQYLLTDALGSTSKVVNAAGAVTETFFFDPFGARINPNGSPYLSAISDVRDGFTGHEHDAALGLINMRGRMFDPAAKRFLSGDPIVSAPSFGQSWHPYSYVGNSPLNLTDPTGYRWVGEFSCLNVPGGCMDGGTSDGGEEPPPTPDTPTSQSSVDAMNSFMAGSEAHANSGGDVARSDGGSTGSGASEAAHNVAIPTQVQQTDDGIEGFSPDPTGERPTWVVFYKGQAFRVWQKDAQYIWQLMNLLERYSHHQHTIYVDPTGDHQKTSAPVFPLPDDPWVLLDSNWLVSHLQQHFHLAGFPTLGAGFQAVTMIDPDTGLMDLPLLDSWLRDHQHMTAGGGIAR